MWVGIDCLVVFVGVLQWFVELGDGEIVFVSVENVVLENYWCVVVVGGQVDLVVFVGMVGEFVVGGEVVVVVV